MCPTELISLPIEVLHHICRYLSVQDVLSCSLTCHYLRVALNDNSVWNRYLCGEMSSLETLEQQVTPSFHLGESLSPLCKNREHYVRRTQLLNNWRGGHYVQYTNTSNYTGETENVVDFIYDDKYLFLHCRTIRELQSRGIEVWDISKVPVCHTFFNVNDGKYDCFFIVDSYLVVVDFIKVLVYQINLPKNDLPLEFSFLVTDNSVTLKESVVYTIDPAKCEDWHHSTINKYLISNRGGENLIHLWDISSASKLGTFVTAIDKPVSKIALKSFFGKNLLFHLSVKSSATHYLAVFNVEKLKFTGRMISFDRIQCLHILLFDTYLLLFKRADIRNSKGGFDTICCVYDINSSLILNERQFCHASKHYRISTVKVLSGKFVFQYYDAFHVVDALSLETVHKFECDNVKFITQQMDLFGSLVVLTICDLISNELQFWDLNRKNKMPIDLKGVYPNNIYLGLDRLCTKLILLTHKRLTILHFW